MSELRKYGESATILFTLFQPGGDDFEPAAPFAAGDVKIMKDEGAEANTTNLPAVDHPDRKSWISLYRTGLLPCICNEL